jgi:hypothetical protein
MICEYCPPSADSEFDMHASASKLKADMFAQYLSNAGVDTHSNVRCNERCTVCDVRCAMCAI